jgi:aminoglycoside phosphotransferase (APT) family kinase protein
MSATDSSSLLDADFVGERLRQVLRQHAGADAEVGGLKRFPVGYSWLTYGFTASWTEAGVPRRRELILRLGPPNGLFAPYSAGPQFLTLQAVRGNGVPVPAVHWHDDSPEAFGAPWFICEKVSGRAPVMWGENFSDQTRAALGAQLVEALAALHRFEWRGTPIAVLGEGVTAANAARAQVDYWEKEMRRWELRRQPMAEAVLAWLRAHCPEAPKVTVVHGDYRIGNFLAEGECITAILDWELVHLGDPHEDLGWMCQRTFRPGTPLICTLIPREELYHSYQRLTGIAVSPRLVHFYEVLGMFKFYVIDVGAERCFEDGRHNDLRLPSMAAQGPRLLLQLEKLIAEAP